MMRMRMGLLCMKLWNNSFFYAQFMRVHGHEHPWTMHEQGMNCEQSYNDYWHKNMEYDPCVFMPLMKTHELGMNRARTIMDIKNMEYD